MIGFVWGLTGFVLAFHVSSIVAFAIAASLPPLALRGLFRSLRGREMAATSVIAVCAAIGTMYWALSGYSS
jgi:hypothetical protein